MKKMNQKGTGVVEVVLLLVLVGLIVGVGYYVYNSQKKTNESLDNASQSLTDATKAKEGVKNKEAASRYLVIKELGVKIELDDATSDAYYVMENGFAYVSTTALKNANVECSAEKTAVAAISKVPKTATDEMIGKTYEQHIKDGGSGVIIGDNVYLMTRAQSYCSEDLHVQAKQQAVWNSFLAKAETMQQL